MSPEQPIVVLRCKCGGELRQYRDHVEGECTCSRRAPGLTRAVVPFEVLAAIARKPERQARRGGAA